MMTDNRQFSEDEVKAKLTRLAAGRLRRLPRTTVTVIVDSLMKAVPLPPTLGYARAQARVIAKALVMLVEGIIAIDGADVGGRAN